MVEPFRTMCIVAMCLGLRASELAALQWNDFDWENRHVTIQRGVVIGRVGEVKTSHSNRAIPLDPGLALMLLSWKRQAGPGEGFPKLTDRQALVALDNSAESSDSRWHQSRDRSNRLAQSDH